MRKRQQMKPNDVPVICAECMDVGRIVRLNGVNYLSCALKNDRVVFNSKPDWCPKGSVWEDERGNK